jgi:thymidylate synthase
LELSLPVVHIIAENLAVGWEEAVLECWNRGARIATMYDKPGDPESRDCSLYLTIANPFAEPRIHRALPGGFLELETYRQEVVEGIHDHWVVTDDPETTKWQYSYHERFASYTVPGVERPVDQLQYVIDALIKDPFTRRALAITWKPWLDEGLSHPPCLQYIWFRIFGDQLVVDCHIRSNDAYKAAYMNMYAFTDWQRMVAEKVSEGLGRTIYPGQYNHIADSFHIYGSYFEEFKGFLQMMEARPDFADRTYRSDDQTFVAFTEESRVKIAASLRREKEARIG